MSDDIKALQYLGDMVDIMEGGVITAYDKGSDAFKKFLEGERLAKLLANLEKGVRGPYWFGNAPTYVDFFWTNIVDFYDARIFDRLEAEFGVKHFYAAYPKLEGVLNAIRSLDSYKACQIPILKSDGSFHAKEEMFAAWK